MLLSHPRRGEMNLATARLLARGLLAAIIAVGCSTDTTDKIVMQTGLPAGRASASLSLEKERGDYLDVVMESGGFRYRFFLPNDEECRSVAFGEQAVTYANVGSFGQLQAGDAACDPIGILSLAAWRDRGPRRRTSAVIPRSRAELRQVVYADEDLTLVRGRFLLAREVGFLGGEDLIAVIPNVEKCRGLAESKQASMEFRQAGKQPYTLVNGKQLCPVIGFVQVPPNP
jgi:hypothetical protein